jgi:putative polyhydroxyalkanoate system protein
MPKFDVEIPHALPPQDVRSRLERAASKLERDYGAKCSFDPGGNLLVNRKGLDAKVLVEANRLLVQVELGLLMTPLAGTIKSSITKELTDLMSAPPSGAA